MVGSDPWSVFVSSVTLYLAEAALLIAFVIGLCVSCVGAARWTLDRLPVFPTVTDRGLARFFGASVVLLAAWSVLFKIVLYAALPPRLARGDLSEGLSFWYANAAEGCLVVLVLIGVAVYLARSARA